MSELLQELLEEFHEKISDFNIGIPREISLSTLKNKIKIAIGMRRTGKTHLLMQKIYSLIQNEMPLSRILYLNFEDDRILPFTQSKLSELIDAFYSLYPENHDHVCYLFLDEIQNINEWPLVVRRYFDTKKVEFYLTGSSAKLLSKEIASSLRGRSIATEVWPFNFTEYLTAIKINYDKKVLGKKSHDQLSEHLQIYLNIGGFPEVFKLDQPDRVRILQDYVNVVIFRDIIERYNITNTALIKYMIKILLKNSGCSFSVNKFYNDLKSQGFAVGKTTIHDYLAYIADAYLCFTVPLYSESLRKTQTNPRKIYAIDTGLVNAYTISRSNNAGHLFKNLVYLDLRRKGHDIYYYLTDNRQEVDFLTKDIDGKLNLYQVAWDVSNPETLEREKKALQAAEKELGIKGRLITPNNYFQFIL